MKPIFVKTWIVFALMAVLWLGADLVGRIYNEKEKAEQMYFAAQGIQSFSRLSGAKPPPFYPSDSDISTAVDYMNRLVDAGCMQGGDLNLLSGYPYTYWYPAPFSSNSIAFTIYRVSADDPPSTILMVSRNDIFKWCQVVIRKDGTGGVYPIWKKLEAIGTLPQGRPMTLAP